MTQRMIAHPESLIASSDLDTLCGLAAAAPPGAFVEVGVYKGGSAVRLYEIAERQGRALYLFDTFAGHPRTSPEDDTRHHYAGRYADAIDPAELRRLLPNAVIVVGEFPGTLPAIEEVAFVHADTDLYHSTDEICRLFPPLMVPGGMLYFDDYGVEDTPGVTLAVDQWFGAGPLLPNGKRVVVL